MSADLEIANAEAASDISYELRKTKEARRLAEARVEVQKAERQGPIEIEQLEIGRRELELVHTVRKPTDAERERIEAQAVKEKALAEAEGLRAKLLAEAEGMQERARTWEHYNAAAVSELFLEKLPEIATAVAKPLERVERIVLVNTGEGSGTGVERITRSATELLAQVPGVAELMRSVDLGELVRSLPSMGARQTAPEAAPAPGAKPQAEPARDEGRAACGPRDALRPAVAGAGADPKSF